MFQWAAVFLVVAIVTAIYGFGGVAGFAAGVAQALFMSFFVVFLITLIGGFMDRRRAAP